MKVLLLATALTLAKLGVDGAPVRHSTPSVGATMAWLESEEPRCGHWPSAGVRSRPVRHSDDETVHDVQFKCQAGSVTDTMPANARARISPSACASWCESAHPPAAGNEWCCQMSSTIGGDNGQCSWTNGARVMAAADATTSYTALEACSAAADASTRVVLAARRESSEEYVCPEEKMQDAIKLDGDGPGLCSQICLPHYLFNIAKKHGVSSGRCKDLGFTEFQYLARQSGIPYNVYA